MLPRSSALSFAAEHQPSRILPPLPVESFTGSRSWSQSIRCGGYFAHPFAKWV